MPFPDEKSKIRYIGYIYSSANSLLSHNDRGLRDLGIFVCALLEDKNRAIKLLDEISKNAT